MRRRTVAIDLDDTVYAEQDYVISSKKAVGSYVKSLFGIDITEKLLHESDDFLRLACDLLKLPSNVKDTLLWIVRTHLPDIAPFEHVTSLIDQVRQSGDAICIITDGRSITQRLKIKALNLKFDAIYISEEVGFEKPNPAAFIRVVNEWPARQYFYVGDNPRKDFYAPNQLGWTTIGISPSPKSIHKFELESLLDKYEPHRWVASFHNAFTEIFEKKTI